jgi:hypothetical protein
VVIPSIIISGAGAGCGGAGVVLADVGKAAGGFRTTGATGFTTLVKTTSRLAQQYNEYDDEE